jgi:hypothetical protein
MMPKEFLENWCEYTPYQIQDEPKSEWCYHLLPEQLEEILQAYIDNETGA